MKSELITLFARVCTYWDEKLYCFARDLNLLFSIDLKDEKLELIDTIPEEDIPTQFLLGSMNIANNKLILGPKVAKKIWIYDLESSTWDNVTINNYNTQNNGINQIYSYKNSVYLIGSGYPAILCLDLENDTCEYIEEPYKEAAARHEKIDFLYFRSHGVQLDHNLYLASCLDNYVLKFDMETKKHQWIKVGDDAYVYSEIAWDGTSFWLSPRLNCDIIKWDGQKKTEILPLPPELKQSTNTYTWTSCYDGRQIVFPCITHPKSIMIDIQQNSYQIFEQQYNLYTRLDNGMVISQTLEGELTIKTDQTVKKFNPSIEINQLKQFYEGKHLSVFNGGTLYHEAPTPSPMSLENYLALLKPASQNKPSADEQVGKVIWEAIR